jgi:VanZ family protein
MLLVTSVPGSAIPKPLIPYDKVVHFMAYGLFAVLLSRDIAQVTGLVRAALFAIVIAATFGAVDEWHQRFIPGRDTDLADWRTDVIGATGGALLFALYHRDRRARIASPR